MTALFDAPHLGVLVGDPRAGRIVALSTSDVFSDRSLLHTFWNTSGAAIDNGIQGHLYTRPNDVLVISVPADAHQLAGRISTALTANRDVWMSLTGLELLSSADRVVLTSNERPTVAVPPGMTWHVGSLLAAATARYRSGPDAFLAFVLDVGVAKRLGLDDRVAPALMRQARTATRLMDKNRAMETLRTTGIDCATSYPFDAGTPLTRVLGLPDDRLYVFKPAGGAAAIGVFPGTGRGAGAPAIYRHVRRLKRERRLPRRFQIQEFLAGEVLGASAVLRDGRFRVLEVHRQSIDADGHFVGAHWSRAEHKATVDTVDPLYQKLAATNGQSLPGLVCLDIIDRRIIEVNPRITAAAPIAHVLAHEAAVSQGLGGHRVDRIDINTQIKISWETVRAGKLLNVAEDIRRRFNTLVLPQGVNPFGRTRVVFVNDDDQGSAQRMFIERVTPSGTASN